MKKHVQDFNRFSVKESMMAQAPSPSGGGIPFRQFVKKAERASAVSIDGSRPMEIDSVLDSVLEDDFGYQGQSIEIASRAGIVTAGSLENPTVEVDPRTGAYIVFDYYEKRPVEVELWTKSDMRGSRWD